jgi:hypothetical protein
VPSTTGRRITDGRKRTASAREAVPSTQIVSEN